MKTAFNRFAIFPVMCPYCHRYIWLETYRHADVWISYADRTLPQNICRDCIRLFNVRTGARLSEVAHEQA